MSLPKKAFVLAAGRGERLKALTEKTPKPLVDLAGRPILHHLFQRLQKLGIEKLVLNSWYKADQIEEYVQKARGEFPFEISVSRESKLLGTGGGLKKALPLLGEPPFWMLNGDVYFEGDLEALVPERRFESQWLLSPVRDDQTKIGLRDGKLCSLGRFWNDGGQEDESGCFAGIQLIQSLSVSELPDEGCLVRNYFIPRLESGAQLGGNSQILTDWEDLGTPERLLKVAERLSKRSESEKL